MDQSGVRSMEIGFWFIFTLVVTILWNITQEIRINKLTFRFDCFLKSLDDDYSDS